MATIFDILRRDVKRIAHNPIALFVTIALCFIPSIYAWFNIAANWNPYANTSGVTVMIANEDEGASLEDFGTMNLGDQVVAKLKDNHELDWQFTDEKTALEKVESGEAYAAIVIPRDFSRQLTSIVTGKIELPQLDYYMNEKLNPVAGKVTDTGASTIENEINTEFVSTVATVVTDALKTAATDVSADTNSSTITALANIQNARDSLDNLSTSISNARTTATNAASDIRTASSDLDGLDTAIDDASTDLSDTIQALRDTKRDVNALSATLSGDLVKAAATINSLSTKVNGSLGDATSALTRTQTALAKAQSTLQSTHDTAQTTYNDLSAIAEALPDGSAKTGLENTLSGLESEIGRTQTMLDTVSDAKDTVDKALSGLDGSSDAINQGLADAATDLTDAATALTTTVTPAIDAAIDTLVDVATDLKSSIDSLPALVSQAQGTLDQLATTLDQADAALGATGQTVSNLSTTLSNVATDLSAIRSGEAYQALKDMIDVNTQDVASLVSTPVTIVDQTVYPVENYGSGVAPFYTNLALFVGGLMLCTLYKMGVDTEGVGDLRPWQAYFGRLLLLVPLAALQAVVTCVGDLVMGIQCVSPVGFVFAGIVGAIVYLNIIYALTVAFKHIGKALCVVIVILQIPGSSGLYPIEMQPAFFQAIYPWLPFTYGNNAMRETIAGFYGSNYAIDLALLALFVAPALLVGVGLRRYLVNIDAMFDRDLKNTGLFVADAPPKTKVKFGITTLIAAALDNPAYKTRFVQRAEKFDRRYPRMVLGGFIAMGALTLIGLVVALFLESKLGILLAWVVMIVAGCAYLIVVEFMHTKMATQASLTTLSHDEVFDLLGARLDESLKTKGVPAPDAGPEKGGDQE